MTEKRLKLSMAFMVNPHIKFLFKNYFFTDKATLVTPAFLIVPISFIIVP